MYILEIYILVFVHNSEV